MNSAHTPANVACDHVPTEPWIEVPASYPNPMYAGKRICLWCFEARLERVRNLQGHDRR